MDIGNLKKALEKIELSQEMQERIIRNCNSQKNFSMEEYAMNKSKKIRLKKSIPMVAILSVFICFAMVGVAVAAMKTGFFKDVTRWDGTVVGTTYEQASEEIEANVTVEEDGLLVVVTMLSPATPPYSEFDEFGISSYQIIDTSGSVVIKDVGTELSVISNGQAEIRIPLNGIERGNYKLVISKFVGSAKADQPLEISGVWECEFEI